MSTLTILFMLRWATLWVNKSNPESTRIRNNQPKRLDYCHIRTTAVVTLVPRLWYESDNSFGTVVTIGIGIVRLVVFRLTVSICRLSISMPSCQCGISVFALAVSFLWTWSCIPTVTQGSQYLLRQSQCHWKFHKIERKHLLYRHILIYCLLNVHIQ